MVSTYFNNFFKNPFEEKSSLFKSDQQNLSEKTDLAAINDSAHFNNCLKIPRDLQIIIMTDLKSPASVLALTSTCKELHNNRVSYFTSIPSVLSNLFYKALINDSLSKWPCNSSPLSPFEYAMNCLTEEDSESNAKKFLNLFQNESYPTSLSIKIPLEGDRGTKTFKMILEILKKFPKTTSIDFTDAGIDNKDLNQILGSCPQLKELILHKCKLTDQGFTNTPFPTTLEQLVLSQNSVNAKGLNNVFNSCQKLQALSIDFCNNFISEQNFNEALTNIPNTITFLSIGTTRINTPGLEKIIKTCSELKSLCLNGTLIGSEGLQAISKHCSKLDSLSLLNCKNISEQDLTMSGLRNRKSLTIKF